LILTAFVALDGMVDPGKAIRIITTMLFSSILIASAKASTITFEEAVAVVNMSFFH
jgi:hypothetical protein